MGKEKSCKDSMEFLSGGKVTRGISKLHVWATLNNETTAGRKSLALLSMRQPGNDNVFVHFSISESPACWGKKEIYFLWLPWIPAYEGFAASPDSSWRSVNRMCQPALTCYVQQMRRDTHAQDGIINTHKHAH